MCRVSMFQMLHSCLESAMPTLSCKSVYGRPLCYCHDYNLVKIKLGESTVGVKIRFLQQTS